jgi:hypothetical protein
MSVGPGAPSFVAMVEVAKVKLANFPSLAKLGERYSKRFGSLSLWAVRGLSGVSIGQNSASNVSHFEGDISRCKNYFDLFRLHNPQICVVSIVRATAAAFPGTRGARTQAGRQCATRFHSVGCGTDLPHFTS